MRHWYCHFGQNDEASLHWRYNLSSPYPADPDARLLSCLSQKSLIPTSESFHFHLPRTEQGFPIAEPRFRTLSTFPAGAQCFGTAKPDAPPLPDFLPCSIKPKPAPLFFAFKASARHRNIGEYLVPSLHTVSGAPNSLRSVLCLYEQ